MIIARFLFFTSIFAMSLTWTNHSEAKTLKSPKALLTYDQFLSLTDEQKLSYIEAVRKLALDLSQNAHFISESDIQNRTRLDQLLSQFLNKAHAGDYDNVDRVCAITDAKSLSDQDLLSAIPLTLNCTEFKEKSGDKAFFRPVAIPRVEAISAEFLSRVEAQRITPRIEHYSDAIGSLKTVISEIKSVGTRTGPVSSNWMGDTSNKLSTLESRPGSTGIVRPQTGSSNRVAAQTKDSTGFSDVNAEQKKSPTRTSSPSPMPTEPVKPEAEKSSAATTTTQTPSADFKDDVQCLYAGFVIPKGTLNKCQPYKELPFTTDFLDKKTFVCPQAEQILCNPLLFGYEETNCKVTQIKDCTGKRPVCVYRSQDATKNCFELAKRKKTLKQTMELWKSPDGEKLYRDYVESLENLCDSSHLERRNLRKPVFDDITKTCEVAFSVFKENVGSEYLPSKISPNEKSSGKR